MPQDPSNKNSHENQEDSFGNIKQPPSNLLNEKVKVVDGRPATITTSDYVKGKEGYTKRQDQEFYELAADGRELPVSEFVARSWTGHRIPRDHFVGPCHDPFGLHENEIRQVYPGVDGILTNLRTVLCDDCREFYEKQLRLEKRTLSLLYKAPEL